MAQEKPQRQRKSSGICKDSPPPSEVQMEKETSREGVAPGMGSPEEPGWRGRGPQWEGCFLPRVPFAVLMIWRERGKERAVQFVGREELKMKKEKNLTLFLVFKGTHTKQDVVYPLGIGQNCKVW